MRVFTGIDEIERAVGEPLGAGPWLTITQDRVDAFADATGDHQWIHVDVERAADGPYGGTIVHGYLTLSLIPGLIADLYRLEGLTMRVNYGLDRVRFPAPVKVGSRVRARATFTGLERTGDNARLQVGIEIECDGVDKPVCVAQTISMLVP